MTSESRLKASSAKSPESSRGDTGLSPLAQNSALSSEFVVEAPRGSRPRWANGQVRFLAAVSLSMYGDWLTTVALVVILFRLTGSAAAPAGYILVRVAPRLAGATIGGVLADRLSPVALLASCWVIQGVLTAAVVPIAGTRSLLGIYLCVGAAQLVNATSSPCRGAIIPRLGQRAHIANINRFFAVGQSSSMFVAPVIGSVVLLIWSANSLLLIDAATFILGAFLIATIELTERGDDAVGVTHRSGRVSAGLASALADPVLRVLLATMFAGGMIVTALQALLVVAAAQLFGTSAAVGWLYAVVGLGGLGGTAIVARWRPRSLSATLLAAAGAAEVGATMLLTVTPVVGIALIFLALSSLAGVVGETWGEIDLQERVDIRLLGRVSAAADLSLYGGMLIGAILAISLSVFLSWQPIVFGVGVVGLIVLSVALASGGAINLQRRV
jgi:hypothetical protein